MKNLNTLLVVLFHHSLLFAMSCALNDLEAEWERFQATRGKSGSCEVSYGDELAQYQELKKKVQDASAEWEKRRTAYLTQLDSPSATHSSAPLPTEKERSIAELIEEHHTLSTKIREMAEKPSVTMGALMKLWETFHTVHQILMAKLCTN